MFPYRRNGGKKRGKGGPQGPHHQQHQQYHQRQHRDHGGGNGRRVPGSAAEMLTMLQPTTKALAQMLAGNARASGQIAHARSVMVHAHRLVEERAVDRLPPAHREEFLEQLARLKLTLTDAEEALEAAEAEPEAPRATVELGADHLREVARRLAISSNTVTAPPVAGPVAADDAEPEPEEEPQPEPEIPAATAARGERIRLRLSPDADGPAPVRARERMRLKTIVKPAVGPSSSGG